MATTEELARDLLASVNTDAGFLNAIKWIDFRYRELCTRFRPRHLRKVGEIQIPAQVSTGVVAVTRDNTAVTGTSTTWATAPTTGTLYGWYFRANSAWYNVASASSDTTLTLTTSYSEDTETGSTYTLIKRFHSLSSGARWLGDAVLTRLRLPLDVIPMESLDRDSPGRVLTGMYPTVMSQQGVDTSGDLWVEFYPYNDDSEIIHYVYWNLPTTLGLTTTIPRQVEPHVLKEGALIDLYRYMMANALDRGNIEQGAVYRNEMRAQMTTWENYIRAAQRADRGVDDTTLILSHIGRDPTPYQSDIRTAHDQVYIRGNRSW